MRHGDRKDAIETLKHHPSYAGITRIRFKGTDTSLNAVSAGKTQHPYVALRRSLYISGARVSSCNHAVIFYADMGRNPQKYVEKCSVMVYNYNLQWYILTMKYYLLRGSQPRKRRKT